MTNLTISMAGSPSDPEDPFGPVGLLVEQIVQKAARGDARLNVVDLDDDSIEDGWTLDEQAYDADILKIEAESIDLTQDDDENEICLPFVAGGESGTNLRCQHYIKGARNPCLCGHHDQENSCSLGDTKFRKDNVHGLKIELRVGRFLVDFIEIKEIWVHRITGVVVVRGFAYTRTRNLDGRLQAYKNEVCRLVEIDTNDNRPVDEQSLIEVTLEDLHPKHRVLHVTNKSFPECRFDPDVYNTNEDREELAPLTARWVHIMQYPDKRYRRAQRPIDGETLLHLRESDVLKARHRDTDSERLRRWRGETVKGGSFVSQISDDNVSVSHGKSIWLPKRRYNAADMFSGAGGYTSGAKRAGIRVVYALDHWARCNATYKANHPEVELKEQDIMTYCNDLTMPDVRYDLVHLSPPCQTWSPAHTCAGKNDSANIAALYACTDIIFRFRPRIVTFEQTFGIIQERHLPWFNALVQSLTKHGYSLMWKVIRLVDYGLPQTRKRLVMIGAAPGEKLPPFPSPTHAAEPDPQCGPNRQKRFISAIKACWGLVDGLGMHDPSGVKQMQRQPWDGSQPMNRTITTSGGQAYHWDGERDLTLAEFARLQGFPENYVFKAPCIKKQIGNAFPPTVVHAIMKQIVHSLEQVDNITSAPREEDIVHIDDGESENCDKVDDDSKGEYYRGDNDAPSTKHEREPEPDHPDHPRFTINGIKAGSFEEDTVMAAIQESRKKSASRGGGVSPASNGMRSPCRGPVDNTSPNFQSMTPTERATWASRIARGIDISQGSSRDSSRDSRRRSSSGSSSVVFTGQRPLPTIIEDDDDHARDGPSAGLAGAGCVDSHQPSSPRAGGPQDDGGRDGSRAAASCSTGPGALPNKDTVQYERVDEVPVLESAASASSCTSGPSHHPVFSSFDSGPGPSDLARLRSQAQSSASGQAAQSHTRCSAPATPVLEASKWQLEKVDDDDALARVMKVSIHGAVQRHEATEQETGSAFVSGVGLGITGISISGAVSVPSKPFGPLAPAAQEQGFSKGEKVYEGKGKGKAVAKRSLDGAGDCDAENGSPPKRGRIEK